MKNFLQKIRVYGIRSSIIYIFFEIRNLVFRQWIRKSYSQRFEDFLIDRILGFKDTGFYIDVGAYDPDRFSNTKRFYRRGWKGINIEPHIYNYKKFVKKRLRDVNLNIGVSDRPEKILFFHFIPETLSTFSKEEAFRYREQGYMLKGTEEIDVKPLAQILHELHYRGAIDFMSIDTEGFDLQVLKGNDWKLFRPKVVCIESVAHSLHKEKNEKNEQNIFLEHQGYKKVVDTGINAIYLRTTDP